MSGVREEDVAEEFKEDYGNTFIDDRLVREVNAQNKKRQEEELRRYREKGRAEEQERKGTDQIT